MTGLTGVEIINTIFNKKTDLNESDLNKDLLQSIKYAGAMAYTVGWDEHKTIEALSYFKQINVTGAKAGVSLRAMLMRLSDPDKGLTLKYLDQYGLGEFEVSPRYNYFLDIVDTFVTYQVSKNDVFNVFKIAGEDFWGLMEAYNAGKLTNEIKPRRSL